MKNVYYEILPWEKYYALIEKFLHIKNPRSVDDYFLSSLTGKPIDTKWYRANEWWEQYLDDEEMYTRLNSLRPFEGELIIVNEVCWFKNWGAFKVNGHDLKEFIDQHQEVFKFYFFDGDTLIINLELKLIWILHHEGIYALVDHNQFT